MSIIAAGDLNQNPPTVLESEPIWVAWRQIMKMIRADQKRDISVLAFHRGGLNSG